MARQVEGNGNRSSTQGRTVVTKSTNCRRVVTPLGPGASIYPDTLTLPPDPEVHLLCAVLKKARQDADWLDELETRDPTTWTLHERRRYHRMLLDVPDPREWLAGWFA